jgi:iron-sulfur cluster insertion protein
MPDTSSCTTEFAPALVFTDAAAAKVSTILASMSENDDESSTDLKLRLSIAGGGCSGFKYEFAFTDEQTDDDTTVEKNGVTLLVDSISLQYLDGATLDYKEDAQGEQFVIRNPKASSTCGCGASAAFD